MIRIDVEHLSVYNIQDKCVVVGDRTVCSRLANDGIFLLDTVFQPSTPNLSVQVQASPAINSNSSLERTLELNVNDAASLLASLKQIEPDLVAGLDSLVGQLEAQLDGGRNASTSPTRSCTQEGGEEEEEETDAARDGFDEFGSEQVQLVSRSGEENSSWSTVKITDSYFSLLSTLSQCLDEIKRTNIQSVAIPILSLLLDRLYRLDTTLIEKHLATNVNGATSSFG